MKQLISILSLLVLAGVIALILREAWRPGWPELRPVEVFEAPRSGDYVQIELESGSSRAGVIRRISNTDVVLETRDGEVTYHRNVIAPRSRQLLFKADFEGADVDERPFALTRDDLMELLDDSPGVAGVPRGRNVQYVISGTNAIIIMRGADD